MSLLQKRKLNEMPKMANNSNSTTTQSGESLLYCLSMMSVVNITFGNPIYDNYFEGVKAVIGAKRAQSIFNQLKERHEKARQNITQQNKNEESLDINKSILTQMHRMLGERINQEIQKRVKLFQVCIDSCMQLSQIPQAAIELLNILRGNEEQEENSTTSCLTEPIKKARDLIQIIRQFIGEEQFIQLIQHSLRKINAARDFSSSSSGDFATAKCKGGDMCEEITTSSTLSDENSTAIANRSETMGNVQENISKLPQSLKQTILARIIPSLSKFQESINRIKAFTSVIA